MTRLARILLFLWLALSAHALPSQRTGVTREDGTQWAWGYNDRGEVTSGGKKFTDGTAQPMLQFGYQYDGIGNRTQSTVASHTATYSPNSRNQFDSRTVPPYLSVTGEVATDANVVVQAKPALRNSAAYWKEWSVDNTSAAVRENVRIAAAKPGAGAGGSDLASLQTGQLYLPPATESFTYDDDGNLTSDSRWTYSWDAENRLLSMEEKTATLPAGWVRQRLEFAYDAGSRRTRKTVKQWNATAWATTSDTAFVYDGWNLIAEVNVMAPASPVVLRTYAWGLDVSQTMQGAGGVGGLLWVQSLSSSSLPSFVFYPAYDGNGNIIGYVDASNGQPVLKLDYDPFGVPVMVANTGTSASATAARALPFRFSTKYQDRESGLNYYGYRYYAAGLGRWINRDPLEERGGVNLYGFVGNRSTNSIDPLGLTSLAMPASGLGEGMSAAGQAGSKLGPAGIAAAAAYLAWAQALTNLNTQVELINQTKALVCELNGCGAMGAIVESAIILIRGAGAMVDVALLQNNSEAAQAASLTLGQAIAVLDALQKTLHEMCPELAALAEQAQMLAEQKKAQAQSLSNENTGEITGGAATTTSGSGANNEVIHPNSPAPDPRIYTPIDEVPSALKKQLLEEAKSAMTNSEQGQHGTAYVRAGAALLRLANENKSIMTPEAYAAYKKEAQRLMEYGKSTNHK